MAAGLAEATSAAAGALTSALVLYPLDLVKTRIQSQLGSDSGLPQYRGIGDGFVQIWRAHSVAGLYEGLGGYSLKASVDNFTYFFWRRFMMTTTARLLGRELSGLAELVISNVAGILHKLINLPLDVVSTRQQTARDGSTMLENATEVVSQKGWAGLWDGLGPTLLLTTNPAITYTCFDVLKRALIGRRAKLVRNSSSCSLTIQALSPRPLSLSFSARAPACKTLSCALLWCQGVVESFAVGVVSKATATVIIYPLIRAKVLQQRAQRLANARVESAAQTNVFASIVGVFTLLAHIARTEGVGSWYTGMPGQIGKASLSSALLLMTKEQLSATVAAAFGVAPR